MSEPYIGEIRLFAGTFAPKDWAICDGSILQIRQHSALYAVLGNAYGGDGRHTFALPDLRDRVPMHAGNGVGLTARAVGDAIGQAKVLLQPDHLPAHTHVPQCIATATHSTAPDNVWAGASRGGSAIYRGDAPNVTMSLEALAPAGGGQPHENMQPYLGVTFIIALQGVYPLQQ